MTTSTPRAQWCPELRGKTAIISGAGRFRSIGRQIALELARQGVNLVLTGTGRDPATYPAEERGIGWRDIASVAEEAEAAGVKSWAVVSDVGDPQAVSDLVSGTVDRFGGLDMLINNAGASRGTDRVPIVELPLAEWDRILQTNLRGAFLMSQAAARAMIAQGRGGAILNISSVASRLAAGSMGAYSVSKAGLNALSRTMAMELAQYGIRVNAVLPGVINTSRMGDLIESGQFDDYVQRFTPLGVAGDGTEIGWMCAYLCSDMGQWITGQDIAVDGGATWR